MGTLRKQALPQRGIGLVTFSFIFCLCAGPDHEPDPTPPCRNATMEFF